MQYQLKQIFPKSESHNLLIAFTDPGSSKSFMCLASDRLPDYHLVGDSQCLPLYRYDTDDNQIDNITDWGLAQFQNYYNDSTITKLDIFYYTYTVLHHPAYRTKYALNLKREFPRFPFYNNFRQWVNWGQQLMNLHVNYQTVAPYPLNRIDIANYVSTAKTKLKSDKNRGTIILDSVTTLADIPAIAWEYHLGDRSALEWILEHYKEKAPKDRTIVERFLTYRFADYKEQVIDLLQRVCTVSVETMRIIREMEA